MQGGHRTVHIGVVHRWDHVPIRTLEQVGLQQFAALCDVPRSWGNSAHAVMEQEMLLAAGGFSWS